MPLTSLLYISRSLIEDNADATVRHIVEKARIANEVFGVTGAILFTGKRFAQIIEGPPSAITHALAMIVRDKRHTDILLVDVTQISSRVFPQWSMAYAGPSVFVQRNVNRAMIAPTGASKPDPLPLIRLMTEFATQH